jgi:hypothetical protein
MNNSEKKFDSIIMLAHVGIEGKSITEQECLAALPIDAPSKKVFINLDITKYKLDELYDAPFEQMSLEQQREFNSKVLPALEKHPNAVIAYFGFASVPASFHVGYLFNGLNDFWVYQYHHTKKEWYREVDVENIADFNILPIDLPNKVEKGKGDIFIRISTSYRIEPQHTYQILSNPTNEFDINLENLSPDAFSNQAKILDLLDCFQNVLSSCSNFLPDRDKIHLFMSTSAGIPFALGTKINPTIFPYVQTYQFSKDRSPMYRKAILIDSTSNDALALTDTEIKIAKKIRKDWANQLKENLLAFITNLPSANWFDQVSVGSNDIKLSIDWSSLPSMNQTSLIHDSIDLKTTTVGNGFKYLNDMLSWQIDDAMLLSIDKRFKKNPLVDKLQAGRLFLFHEGLHYSPDGHNLGEEIATGIGRFPKVIEKADYQADAWAILHEYKFSSIYDSSKVNKNLKKFFLDTIDTAVETMWSFNDNGKEMNQIPIRSMNRFLNWYWQWIRIEQLKGNGTFEEITSILFEQPTIEFAGAEITTINQRTYFKLADKPVDAFEMAIFYKNRVHRFAPTRISDIVLGFKQLDGDKIKTGLRSFYLSI